MRRPRPWLFPFQVCCCLLRVTLVQKRLVSAKLYFWLKFSWSDNPFQNLFSCLSLSSGVKFIMLYKRASFCIHLPKSLISCCQNSTSWNSSSFSALKHFFQKIFFCSFFFSKVYNINIGCCPLVGKSLTQIIFMCNVICDKILHVCLMVICGKVMCIGVLSLISNIRIYVQQ